MGLECFFKYPLGMRIGQQAYFIEEMYGVHKVAHNDFIGVLIEYGILGLIIYLYFFYKVYYNNSNLAKIILLGLMLELFTLSCYPYILIIGITMAMLLYNKTR